jgi:hypothetical protein
MAAVVVAAFLGAFILLGTGFLQADMLHNAAHGAKLNQALVRNVRTWPAMPREAVRRAIGLF